MSPVSVRSPRHGSQQAFIASPVDLEGIVEHAMYVPQCPVNKGMPVRPYL